MTNPKQQQSVLLYLPETAAMASSPYRLTEISLPKLQEPFLTTLASWISTNNRFSPYDQINRSLLPGSAPPSPYHPTHSTPPQIEKIKSVLMREKLNPRMRVLMITGKDDPCIHGIAWLTAWNRQLAIEPVNEQFFDPSRDHNDFIDHMLRNEPVCISQSRQAFYVELAKALRNRHFAHFKDNVIELRDIMLSSTHPRPEALNMLVKGAISLARSAQALIITTLPRLYLEINHELDRQGFRVVDTDKYPFLYLDSAGMKMVELRSPHESTANLQLFLRRVPVDIMLRVYDKAITPEKKASLGV
ncbi:hypothetical protein F4804DRAFT_250003 [Jackrogersella minutella]|nr:hypothetical protein F4804DRAFT_250003 [Jackrogersella minutella]